MKCLFGDSTFSFKEYRVICIRIHPLLEGHMGQPDSFLFETAQLGDSTCYISFLQNEIFASRHQDENSVACIEEKCYVLTFAEYCR